MRTEIIEGLGSEFKNKLLQGDCAGANLSGAYIGQSRPRLVLRGCFTNANFKNATFKWVDFRGDFSGANFEGALAENCILSGKFDGAQYVGRLIASSWGPLGATFKGADMRGAHGTFNLCDIEHARIEFWDRITVRAGRMQLLGVDCELLKPAQFMDGFTVSRDATCIDPDTPDLRHIEGGGWETSSIALHDLVNLSREIDGVSRWKNANSIPPGNYCQRALPLYLNAPDVAFTNFHTCGWLRLSGNFDRASFKDSNISILALDWGSFNEIDLSRAAIEFLDLNMDGIQIKRPSLPSGLQKVTLVWKSLQKRNRVGIRPAHAAAIIDAWNDKFHCEHLLSKLTARISVAGAMNYLGSRGKTLRGVCRRQPTFGDSELAMIAALVARRNQL